ncbi:hypothetical protein BPORC_1774 [Bifidobacterium porcinum]|nr:hypothetical protein BPORC_1774 [Bifidobacterium porcinum]
MTALRVLDVQERNRLCAATHNQQHERAEPQQNGTRHNHIVSSHSQPTTGAPPNDYRCNHSTY